MDCDVGAQRGILKEGPIRLSSHLLLQIQCASTLYHFKAHTNVNRVYKMYFYTRYFLKSCVDINLLGRDTNLMK